MIKVVVDAFGGDNSPHEIVKGAIAAVKENDDFCVVLSGKKDKIEELLKENNFSSDRLSILEANDVITNDESATMAIRQKKDSILIWLKRMMML